MNKQTYTIYKYFFSNDRGKVKMLDDYSIIEFFKQYAVRGGKTYIKYLEYKSKEAREIWGRQIKHSRGIRGKKWI